MDGFSDRYDAVGHIRNGLAEEALRSSQSDGYYLFWVQKEIERALEDSKARMETARDGISLAHLYKITISQSIYERVLATVKQHLVFTPMTMAFATSLLDFQDDTNAVLLDIISGISHSFSMSSLTTSSDPNRRQRYNIASENVDEDNSCNIAALFCYCQKYGLLAELDLIASKFGEEAQTVQLEWFFDLYLPTLKKLSVLIGERKIPIQDSPLQPLFQNILSTFIARYVRAEPIPPKDWTRPKVSCECEACEILNAFLQDPTKQVRRFEKEKKVIRHLFAKVGTTGFSRETEGDECLLIAKTLEEYAENHAVWKYCHDIAITRIKGLGSEGYLESMLLDQYPQIMAASIPRAISSKKRKAADGHPNR